MLNQTPSSSIDHTPPLEAHPPAPPTASAPLRPHWHVVGFLSTIMFFIPGVGVFAALFVNSLPLGLAALFGYNVSVLIFLPLIPVFAALHGITLSKIVSWLCHQQETQSQNIFLSLGLSTIASIPGNLLFGTVMNNSESLGPGIAAFILMPVSLPIAYAVYKTITKIRHSANETTLVV